DAHQLRHPGEGVAPEQPRRRHGAPVAGPVLRQPLLGVRQDAAQEGLREGGGSRWVRLRTAGGGEHPGAPPVGGGRGGPGGRPPRGDGRPERPRLPHGRPGAGLQGHDHGPLDPGAREAARRRFRRGRPGRDVLTPPGTHASCCGVPSLAVGAYGPARIAPNCGAGMLLALGPRARWSRRPAWHYHAAIAVTTHSSSGNTARAPAFILSIRWCGRDWWGREWWGREWWPDRGRHFWWARACGRPRWEPRRGRGRRNAWT